MKLVSWDEAEKDLYTPEEIAESDERVRCMLSAIEAQERGLVTQLEVDAFDKMLEVFKVMGRNFTITPMAR